MIWLYWRTEARGYHLISLLIGLLLSVPLAFHLLPALNQISRDRGGAFPLSLRGHQTLGRVLQVTELRHSVRASPRSRSRLYVHLNQIAYEYAVQGRTFRRIGTIPSEDAFGLSPGARVSVTYLASQPAESRLAIPPADSVFVWKQRLGILSHLIPPIGMALFGLAGTVRSLFMARRRSGLIHQGQAASGCFLGFKEIASPSGNRLLASYRFVDASGKLHESAASMPLHLQGRRRSGDEITVLYDPANPGRSEPDLFDLRTPPSAPNRGLADGHLHGNPAPPDLNPALTDTSGSPWTPSIQRPGEPFPPRRPPR